MKTTLRTTHGEFTGRSQDSIIRREYGRKAYRLNDMIVEDVHRGCHGVSWEANVLAKIRSITNSAGDTTYPGLN